MQDSNIEAQRRDTAFHEAGHVVVSYRLGFQLGYTTIEPNAADGTAGAASGQDPSDDGRQDADYIVTLFAGFAAERQNNSNADERRSGRDNERAAEILGRHSELSAVQLRPRAEALVIEHWKEIEAVSAALIEDITLNETEPQIICDAVGEGRDWRQDLSRYRQFRGDDF